MVPDHRCNNRGCLHHCDLGDVVRQLPTGDAFGNSENTMGMALLAEGLVMTLLRETIVGLICAVAFGGTLSGCKKDQSRVCAGPCVLSSSSDGGYENFDGRIWGIRCRDTGDTTHADSVVCRSTGIQVGQMILTIDADGTHHLRDSMFTPEAQ